MQNPAIKTARHMGEWVWGATLKNFVNDTVKKKRNLKKNTVLHKLNVRFINTALYLERNPKFAVEADVCLPARLPPGVQSPPPCVEEAKHNKEEKSERKMRRREENEQRTGRNNTK